MSLQKRLDALERTRSAARCSECVRRPPYVVIWPDKLLPDPKPCKGCGWEPVHIKVEYVDYSATKLSEAAR